MLGIQDLTLPPDYSASKDFASDVAKHLVDPLAQIYRRSQEIAQMPAKQQVVEYAKDTGKVIGGIATSAGRLATSAVDAVQMAVRNKPDPINWDEIPVLRGIPSYQRSVEKSVESGTPAPEAVAGAVRDLGVDALSVAAPVKLAKEMTTTARGEVAAAAKQEPVAAAEKAPKAKEPRIVETPIDTRPAKPDTVRSLYVKQGAQEITPRELYARVLVGYKQGWDGYTKAEVNRAARNLDIYLGKKTY